MSKMKYCQIAVSTSRNPTSSDEVKTMVFNGKRWVGYDLEKPLDKLKPRDLTDPSDMKGMKLPELPPSPDKCPACKSPYKKAEESETSTSSSSSDSDSSRSRLPVPEGGGRRR